MTKRRSFTLLTLALMALMPAAASEKDKRFTLETNSTVPNSIDAEHDNHPGKKHRNGIDINANSLKKIMLQKREDKTSSPAYLLHNSLPNNQ